jgi:uncharacterized protein (TIGR02246 family)
MVAASPEALATAFSDALNHGDADALGALFAPDSVFVNIAGRRMLGRDGIIDGTGGRWPVLSRAAR